MACGEIGFLGNQLRLLQPTKGYRPGMDALLLSAFAPILPEERLLDAGTGTGTLLLCLNKRMPQGLRFGVGVDIQTDMVALARQNFILNNAPHLSSLVAKMPMLPFKGPCFDHIVTNPPYSDLQTQQGSPVQQKSLSHQGTGVSLVAWFIALAKILSAKGKLSCIIPAAKLPAVFQGLSMMNGFKILPVMTKPDQPINRFLVTCQKGVKAAPIFYHPLILENRLGQPTLQIQQLSRGEQILSFI